MTNLEIQDAIRSMTSLRFNPTQLEIQASIRDIFRERKFIDDKFNYPFSNESLTEKLLVMSEVSQGVGGTPTFLDVQNAIRRVQ